MGPNLIERAYLFIKKDARQFLKYSIISVVVYLGLTFDLWVNSTEAVLIIALAIPFLVLAIRLSFFLIAYRGDFESSYVKFVTPIRRR